MIVAYIIYGLCSLLFLLIGIVNYRQKTPVTFYSSEKARKPEELNDVTSFNKKHGIMWILFGFAFFFSFVFGINLNNLILVITFTTLSPIILLVIMILYHQFLVRTYVITK